MTEQPTRAEQLEKKRTYWKQQIESWQESGMTQLAFCRKHDLVAHRFTYWKKRFFQTDSGITFVPIKFRNHSTSPVPSKTLHLVVDRNFQIELHRDFDSQLLRKVISVIRSLP